MKKQNIKQNIPPSPALIKQLNEMGYIISNDNVIIKVRTKESNEVQKKKMEKSVFMYCMIFTYS
jgi:hypothetical protein